MSHSRIAIVGAGFAGLGAAIRLRQEGIEDFVVFEKNSDVGGTWWDNSYPGCQCDVPSHLYSFSFALNPDWSHTYSPQPEIWAYLRRTAERFGVLPHIRLNTPVLDACWDESTRAWRLETPATLPMVANQPGTVRLTARTLDEHPESQLVSAPVVVTVRSP